MRVRACAPGLAHAALSAGPERVRAEEARACQGAVCRATSYATSPPVASLASCFSGRPSAVRQIVAARCWLVSQKMAVDLLLLLLRCRGGSCSVMASALARRPPRTLERAGVSGPLGTPAWLAAAARPRSAERAAGSGPQRPNASVPCLPRERDCLGVLGRSFGAPPPNGGPAAGASRPAALVAGPSAARSSTLDLPGPTLSCGGFPSHEPGRTSPSNPPVSSGSCPEISAYPHRWPHQTPEPATAAAAARQLRLRRRHRHGTPRPRAARPGVHRPIQSCASARRPNAHRARNLLQEHLQAAAFRGRQQRGWCPMLPELLRARPSRGRAGREACPPRSAPPEATAKGSVPCRTQHGTSRSDTSCPTAPTSRSSVGPAGSRAVGASPNLSP
mmetsp:Transcript_12650/g.34123  ORF Transcript_12650/g.34123 Transcript_12650/m.34123 type:complete len:390 (+) Transcript_12650:634-1803(+)